MLEHLRRGVVRGGFRAYYGMSATESASICGVVVTHEPDVAVLSRALGALRPQVDMLVVVDNASRGEVRDWLRSYSLCRGSELLNLAENLGVGAAANHGIAWAAGRGYSHVLLLDQDSVAYPDMVRRLLSALREIESRGTAVAGVGPRPVDVRTGKSLPFIRVGIFGVRRTGCRVGTSIVPVDFLISSGMLIPRHAFDCVGMLDGEMFIDDVDTDWCFRARSLGLGLFGICSAQLEHSLGEQVIRVWLGRWVNIYRHAPLRQYYMMRNRILLYRRRYSPRRWVMGDLFRLVFKFLVFAVFLPPRLLNVRMMLSGIRDGLQGKTGKLYAA